LHAASGVVAGRSTRSLGVMLQTLDTHREFEAIAKAYLAEHSGIHHEWRPIRDAWSGGRTDLICEPGSANEVWASLRNGQIAVGATGIEHTDFEDFGRDLTDRDLAAEAFGHFVRLLKLKGIVPNASNDA
jgi:hypothetical protein